jgi:hypothetical protein
LIVFTILFSFNRDFTNNQWFYYDVLNTLIPLIFAGKSNAAYKLQLASVTKFNFRFYFYFSIFGQILLQCSMLIGFYFGFKILRLELMENAPYYFDGVFLLY